VQLAVIVEDHLPLSKPVARVALALAAILCIAASYWQMGAPFEFHLPQADFEVYYTAASLIQDHQREAIYDGADTGIDPQLRNPAERSTFAREALSRGLLVTGLFVYPPTLAYLTAPLGSLPVAKAEALWKMLNWAATLTMAALLSRLLGIRLWSLSGLSIALFLFAFRPSLECFFWGQVTLLLTLMEVAGMFLYVRGCKGAAAFFFALAAAIKLTPAIVLVPLIAWRDWKTLRAFLAWSGAILAALCLPDKGRLVFDFFARVLPPMAPGIVRINNKGLSASLQVFWHALRPGASTEWLAIFAKLVSVCLVLYAGWLCRSKPGDENGSDRFEALSLLWLLSCCLAPVSWRHAYVPCAPALLILSKRLLEGRARVTEAILLLSFLLSISSFGFAVLAQSTGNPLITAWAISAPVLGIALVIVELRRMRSENRATRLPAESNGASESTVPCFTP
jgi:hypothetical protein